MNDIAWYIKWVYMIYVLNSPVSFFIYLIQRHKCHAVPNVEVLEHVSSILKDFGFCLTREGIDARNLYCSFFFCNDSAFSFLDHVLFFLLFLKPSLWLQFCKTSDRELHDKGLCYLFLPLLFVTFVKRFGMWAAFHINSSQWLYKKVIKLR